MKRRRAAVSAFALVVGGLAFACRSSEVPSSVPTNGIDGAASIASISIPPPAVGADASSALNAAHAGGSLVGIAYARDGTLIAETEGGLIAIATDGTRAELPLPGKSILALSALGTSVAIADGAGDHVLVVSLSPLAIVGRMPGRPLGSPPFVAVETNAKGDRDLALQLIPPGTTALVRLALPDKVTVHADSFEMNKNGHYAVVAYTVEDGDPPLQHMVSFDLRTGHRMIELPLPEANTMGMTTTALTGDHAITFRGGDIVEIDLATGGTVRHASFACKRVGDDMIVRGNPIVDPTGQRLIATCNNNGVLLDAQTFRRIRTFPDLIPGCDNGFDLPAHFRDDGKQLVVEGCGGESRLDLATGRFACGDADELMGKPYGMGMPPTGMMTPQKRPAAAIGVPTCHPASNDYVEVSHLSAHWDFAWESEDKSRLLGPNQVVIALGKGAGPNDVVVGPNEDRFAVRSEARVSVRALPSGAAIHDFTF